MNELIGHDIEFNNLSINLNKSNLHNSIIIHGPKGIGKRTFIDELLINLLKSIFKDKNLIHHINLFKNITHPNIKILKKDTDTKTKKIKSYITIDQIRNIRNFVNETSSVLNMPKVIIVDSADDFNNSSANSFLKTLEEPKPNTYIFLICHQISSILPTLRSRCLKIKLNNLNYENFKKIVQNNIENIDNEEIDFLFMITNGCPGESILLYDDNLLELFDLTINCISINGYNDEYIYLSELISKFDNEKFKNYLSILKSVLILLNKFKLNYYKTDQLLSKKLNYLYKVSSSLKSKKIIDRLEFLTKNENDLFTYNLDKRIFMLNFLNN